MIITHYTESKKLEDVNVILTEKGFTITSIRTIGDMSRIVAAKETQNA